MMRKGRASCSQHLYSTGKKLTTGAAESDSRVPAGDTMGPLQLFRQAVLRKWQPSSLSHISEVEVAAFVPLSVTWQAGITADEK